MTRFLIGIGALLSCMNLYSQDYKVQSTVINTTNSDRVQIKLSPDFLSYSIHQYSDIRALDQKGNEVPFYLYSNTNNTTQAAVPKVIYSTLLEKEKTVLLIQNRSNNTLQHLNIIINNTNVTKKAILSGSNNSKEWFVVSNSIDFIPVQLENKSQSLLSIDFPSTNYSLLRLEINDSTALPYQIIDIQLDKQYYSQRVYDTVKAYRYKSFHSTPKVKIEYPFAFERPYELNAFSIKANDVHYSRMCNLYYFQKKKVRNKYISERVWISRFNLTHETELYTFPTINADHFVLEIEPMDNQPLKIREIKLLTHPIYMAMSLIPQDSVKLIIDTTLTTPNYDIEFLKKQPINTFSLLSMGEIIANQSRVASNEVPFYQKKVFMWSCIFVVAGLLMYFSIKMIQDIGKEGKE